MTLHRHDDRGDVSVPTDQVAVDGPPPLDAPPPPSVARDVASATDTSPPSPFRPRRRTRTAWLVGVAVMCLVVTAVALGVRSWDLDGQVSDLTEENGTLDRKVADLTAENDSLTAERDSIRKLFPITQESLADADVAGTYEFLFVPVKGKCTYSDCDQLGSTRHQLSISRTPGGYTLALEGVPGPPAPMSREGGGYSSSGMLPKSMWGTCDNTPAETSFELHLTVTAVGLAGSDLRAVGARGTYRQYTPYAGLDCAASESTSTFTARRTG